MKVTIVGASGAVGREFLRILEQRKFPLDEPILFDSQYGAGTTCLLRGKDHEVRLLQHNDDLKDIDITFISVDGGTSGEFAGTITKHDTVMVGNSSAFRMDEDVSLMMPEVDTEDTLKHSRNTIASPNCTTIMMVVVLKPINDLSRIKRVHTSFYQSASGAGTAVMTELQQQYKELVETGSVKTINEFPHQLAYNVIPQIDVFMNDGYTKEEMKMFNETHKIMHSDVKTGATCVRIPSLCSCSESVQLETERPLPVEKVRQAVAATSGYVVKDSPTQASYPVLLGSAGHDDIYVGRIRKDLTNDNGTTLWLTGDQIRKGAALNIVQITGYFIEVDNVK